MEHPVSRRKSIAILVGTAFGFAASLKELASPKSAFAYVPCECQTFIPSFYQCINHTLYLIGEWVDCRNHAVSCSGLIGIPVGCC